MDPSRNGEGVPPTTSDNISSNNGDNDTNANNNRRINITNNSNAENSSFITPFDGSLSAQQPGSSNRDPDNNNITASAAAVVTARTPQYAEARYNSCLSSSSSSSDVNMTNSLAMEHTSSALEASRKALGALQSVGIGEKRTDQSASFSENASFHKSLDIDAIDPFNSMSNERVSVDNNTDSVTSNAVASGNFITGIGYQPSTSISTPLSAGTSVKLHTSPPILLDPDPISTIAPENNLINLSPDMEAPKMLQSASTDSSAAKYLEKSNAKDLMGAAASQYLSEKYSPQQSTALHSTQNSASSPQESARLSNNSDKLGINRHHLKIGEDQGGQNRAETDDQQGGRLWKAAIEEAERQSRQPRTREYSKFALSLIERTQSRADPNALIPRQPLSSSVGKSATMVKIGDNEDAFFLRTTLAKKRVRVVQLLVIGLVGLLLGFVGNFFVSTSCHFASVQIPTGGDDRLFWFHFGLWKYSPIDSVFQGYSYCYKYEGNFTDLAPIFSRATNVVALLAGAFSIAVVWLYLILGHTRKGRWKVGVWFAVFAGANQLATLGFLMGSICRQYNCTIGPAGILSILTSIVWFTLAYEMCYHMPIAIEDEELQNTAQNSDQHSSIVTSLEMSHLGDVTREYMGRVPNPPSTPSCCGSSNEKGSYSTQSDRRSSSRNRRHRSRSGSRSRRNKSSPHYYEQQQHGSYEAPVMGSSAMIPDA